MPTYNNPINFGSGLKIGQGAPVDDRFIFNNLVDATGYVTGPNAFFVYEGLWIYLLDPGGYYFIRRVNTGIPWDSVTNPYIVVDYSSEIGGLPALGLANQQLVVNPAGTAPVYDSYTSRGFFRAIDAAISNPSLVAGRVVRHTGPNVFEDVYQATNYPINSVSKLPSYFLFAIEGNDFILGQYGVYTAVGHGLTQRVPLYLRAAYTSGTATYYTNILSTTASTVNGQYNKLICRAVDSNTLFIDMTHEWSVVGANSGVGTGNATIARYTIQKAGAGGIPEGPDGFFEINHGFGDQVGIVQIVALNTSPAPDLASGNVLVTADVVGFITDNVRIKLDYGTTAAESLIYQVTLIF